MTRIFGKLVLLFAVLCMMSTPAFAGHHSDNACTDTAKAAYRACRNEARDDFWIAIGNCYNLSDPEARDACMETAMEEFMEAKEECKDQKEARLEICEELGEAPYDPIIDPDGFVDFEAVLDGTEVLTPNRYFPLVPGTTWEYFAKDADGIVFERILVEVLEESKEILGVNCIVVRDRVWEVEGSEETLIEDTDDWHGQDLLGNVWYMGEIVLNFEDDELVDIEGSWKAGIDSAKAGYIMLADPQEGDFYRQEFALGDAEDMGKVENRGEESVSVPFGTYTVDVLKTRDFNPIEFDVFEFKYYAPGVGTVLEVNPEDGERVELFSMTTP